MTPGTNVEAVRAVALYITGISGMFALVPVWTTPFGEILTWHTLTQVGTAFGTVFGLCFAAMLGIAILSVTFRAVFGRWIVS